jgi:endoribonuclease Dicer
LLHCEIATTSDTLLRNNISLPKEEVLFYRPIQSPFKTDLQLALSSRLGTDAPFTKLFKTAEAISAELGPWCANTFWSFAFSEEATQKLERRTQFEGHMTRKKLAELDEKIKKLRQAEEIVKDYPFVQVPYEENDLSSKVLALRNCLLTHFEANAHHRCIVFVERRATARLLHSVFTYIGGVHIRPGVLVGVSVNVAGDATQSLRSQIMTTTRFKSGALNCLFATSVAEEGLDIQQCSIVIRFDLYKTMISYVQSRGRARHKDSKFIHMLEDGNLKHREAYNEAKSSEYVMRRFCQSLPQDRVIQKEDVSMEELMAEERNFPFYQDPHTGAKLTYSTCLQVLSNFVDSLPKEGDGPETANYVLSICDDKFVCEVILPQISPVRSAVGRPH